MVAGSITSAGLKQSSVPPPDRFIFTVWLNSPHLYYHPLRLEKHFHQYCYVFVRKGVLYLIGSLGPIVTATAIALFIFIYNHPLFLHLFRFVIDIHNINWKGFAAK
jgi:hypothetical protein